MKIVQINNVSDMYFGLLQPATNFYIWFGKQQYQEHRIGMKPPSYILHEGDRVKVGQLQV